MMMKLFASIVVDDDDDHRQYAKQKQNSKVDKVWTYSSKQFRHFWRQEEYHSLLLKVTID